jgi:peptidyl-dipeptidase A
VKKHIALALLLVVGCKKASDSSAPPDHGSDKGSAVDTGSGDKGSGDKGSDGVAANDEALIAEAKKFVAEMDGELRKLYVDASQAQWNNETDITKEHEDAASKAGAEQAKGITRLIKAAKKFEPILDKLDPDTKRQLVLLKFSGQPAPDDPAKADELAKIATEMSSIYGKGKVCDGGADGKNCKDLDALSKVLQTSRKPAELLAAWKGWHDNVGHAERDLFIKYVDLANEGARGVGFKDVASMWKSGYDMPEDAFEAETDRLFNQLKPLYTQLHCYTRTKLNKMYGDKIVPKNGTIPAHLLGNMWAQTWDYLYKELEPFPGQAPIDVSKKIEATLDDKKMVQMAEAFYTSLGFPALPATFWERSMFQKPKGKDAVCHASAWDVTFNDDLRIKMCINHNQEDLDTIHHELGHDMYYAAYYKKPILFQGGANDGFHEAIGDTVVLSMTPGYLKQKGLLDKVEANDKITINLQMKKALEKIAFLPWGLLVDKWRWDVFSGKVAPADYNKHWWELREKYQGISAPVERAATDFDPGAKYHVPANVPYMRYFLAAVLQFQFHRALCKKAGFTGPLHECSIYNNKEAGKAYWAMLEKGASQPWQDTLAELTGSREMDATAILEYFAPLQKWLEEQNKGQTCGW